MEYGTGNGTEYGNGTGTVSGTGTGWQMGEWYRQQRTHRVHQSQNPSLMSGAPEWPEAYTPAEPAASDWPPRACLTMWVPCPPCRSTHCSSCAAASE